MPAADSCFVIASIAAAVAAVAAAAGAWLVRGSTAVPAAAWGLAAATVLALEMAVRAAGGLGDPAAAAAVRLVATALSVCPAMALLGAKRPQHGVWQFIVATLAIVLALPAVAATLVRPGAFPDVHPLGRCFLLVLVAVGWVNFVATRHGAVATLVAAGQAILLRAFLPLPGWGAGDSAAAIDALGCLLVGLGAAVAVLQSARAAGHAPASRGDALAARIDPPYLALRETLGAAWTLRIAERFDAVAAVRGWPCRLRFGGLEAGPVDGDTAWHRDAERLFRSLMRRFVSVGWLRRHRGS